MTSPLSTTALEKARKAHSTVLQSMSNAGTARNVAQILGVSDTTISRTKQSLEDAIVLLYHLGFKVVSQDCKTVPADYLASLQVLARMQVQQPVATLNWDEQ